MSTSRITRMTRYGHSYQIVLDCGHTLEGSSEDISLSQLFISKHVRCEQCERELDDEDCSPAGPVG